jgi:hypothetical protein
MTYFKVSRKLLKTLRSCVTEIEYITQPGALHGLFLLFAKRKGGGDCWYMMNWYANKSDDRPVPHYNSSEINSVCSFSFFIRTGAPWLSHSSQLVDVRVNLITVVMFCLSSSSSFPIRQCSLIYVTLKLESTRLTISANCALPATSAGLSTSLWKTSITLHIHFCL